MKAKFVFVRSPHWDDPQYRKWHLQDSGENWKAPLESTGEAIADAISDMSREDAIKYLDYMGRPYRMIDDDTAEITLSE